MAQGAAGAETFLKEVVWREFAYHLMFHTPHILTKSWREEWQSFAWSENEDTPEVLAWKQGRTGYRFVDAAMRELYVTGTMHNRGRMIVGSYLTKHMMTHWRVGLNWFQDCLIDWDPAANAMGWQWVAGSGPDAAPYFRVFNPVAQGEKFDPAGVYTRRFVPELAALPDKWLHKPWQAPESILEEAGIVLGRDYPEPIVDLKASREAALDAYRTLP